MSHNAFLNIILVANTYYSSRRGKTKPDPERANKSGRLFLLLGAYFCHPMNQQIKQPFVALHDVTMLVGDLSNDTVRSLLF